jgi:hypothetical protein
VAVDDPPRFQDETDDYPVGPVVFPAHRETAALDLFISVCVTSAVRSSESDLLLSSYDTSARRPGQSWLFSQSPSEEARDDVFEYHQPRTRIEDLVIQLSLERGDNKIVLPRSASRDRPPTPPSPAPPPNTPASSDDCVLAEDISVRFSLRKVELLLPFASESRGGSGGSAPRLVRKPVAEWQRKSRDEPLETAAQHLLDALIGARLHKVDSGLQSWYVRQA